MRALAEEMLGLVRRSDPHETHYPYVLILPERLWPHQDLAEKLFTFPDVVVVKEQRFATREPTKGHGRKTVKRS